MSSFIWKLLERFSSQAISLFVTIILARLLLPEDFGIIAIIVIFIELSNVIIDGGLNTALIQKKEADNLDFSTILYFSIAISGILYGLLYLAAPFIADFYNNNLLIPVLRVLSVNLFFNAFNAIQRAYIAKHMLFNKLFYCNLAAILASGFIGIAMAYHGWGVWALVCQQIVNQAMLTIVMWFMIKWRPIIGFSFLRFKGLFDYGWKIFATNMIIAVYENIRSLIIGKIYQPATLAYFDRGKQFPSLVITNISVSLQTILLPAFSDIQDDRERVRQMMKRSIELVNSIILPILVCLAVSAKPLVILLLTEKWLPAVPFLQIFCIAYMLIPIQSSNMSAIKALGYSGITLKIELMKKFIETIILIVSFLISVYAVAWGIVLYNFVCIIINLYPCKKLLNYGVTEQVKDVLPYVLISAVMGTLIFAISLVEMHPGLLLFLQACMGITIYILLNAFFCTNSYAYAKKLISERIIHRL
jgi:O-antigen/teichoic acid export membrane protein